MAAGAGAVPHRACPLLIRTWLLGLHTHRPPVHRIRIPGSLYFGGLPRRSQTHPTPLLTCPPPPGPPLLPPPPPLLPPPATPPRNPRHPPKPLPRSQVLIRGHPTDLSWRATGLWTDDYLVARAVRGRGGGGWGGGGEEGLRRG